MGPRAGSRSRTCGPMLPFEVVATAQVMADAKAARAQGVPHLRPRVLTRR
jgi:hypothetical protein